MVQLNKKQIPVCRRECYYKIHRGQYDGYNKGRSTFIRHVSSEESDTEDNLDT